MTNKGNSEKKMLYHRTDLHLSTKTMKCGKLTFEADLFKPSVNCPK